MLNYDSLKSNIDIIYDKVGVSAEASGRGFQDITIIAATKMQDTESIKVINKLGIMTIGENRVQELLSKYDDKIDVKWHFIGQLQTNKVKYICDKVELIQSLDRLPLAEQINKEAIKRGIVANTLIEVNVANELSKGGIIISNINEFARQVNEYTNINVQGIMSVVPDTEDKDKLEYYFKTLKDSYDELGLIDGIDNKYLSMGMSNDYEQAIECGSNMVRLGRIIFGYGSRL